MTMRLVQCKKLGKELPGLETPPLKNPLGERIYNEISLEAWKLWLKHSTMIINEYRLKPHESEAQKTLLEHMEKFFFGESTAPPPGFVPTDEKNQQH